MRAIRRVLLLSLSTVALSACGEEKSDGSRPLPPTAADLYEFKPPPAPPSPPAAPIVVVPPPPPLPPPEPSIPVAVFPDPAPLDRAIWAAKLMEHRRQAGAAMVGTYEPIVPTEIRPPAQRLED